MIIEYLFPGVHESYQLDVLYKMQELVTNMHFYNKEGTELVQTKKPFQKGILVSIKSTLDLYKEVKGEGLEYLLTSRLNQDALENFFSQIRGMGGSNTHPSSVEFINRLRKLCLMKDVQLVTEGPNVLIDDTVISHLNVKTLFKLFMTGELCNSWICQEFTGRH